MFAFLKHCNIFKFANFFSKPTMPRDSFQQLFLSDITRDTSSFRENICSLLVSSPVDPDILMMRFMVQSITLLKHTSSASQHEYLSINVIDSDNARHVFFSFQF